MYSWLFIIILDYVAQWYQVIWDKMFVADKATRRKTLANIKEEFQTDLQVINRLNSLVVKHFGGKFSQVCDFIQYFE